MKFPALRRPPAPEPEPAADPPVVTAASLGLLACPHCAAV